MFISCVTSSCDFCVSPNIVSKAISVCWNSPLVCIIVPISCSSPRPPISMPLMPKASFLRRWNAPDTTSVALGKSSPMRCAADEDASAILFNAETEDVELATIPLEKSFCSVCNSTTLCCAPTSPPARSCNACFSFFRLADLSIIPSFIADLSLPDAEVSFCFREIISNASCSIRCLVTYIFC